MIFKVDTLIAIFAFIVRQLLKAAEHHAEQAEVHQVTIDQASALKKAALEEAKRADSIAKKVEALIS